MNRTGILVVVAVLLTAHPAWADCDGIPFKPGAIIFEPNQRAVIGYNGKEEILLLFTDLHASEPTKDFTELLKGRDCMLRTWEIRGPLSGFKHDVHVLSTP